MCLTIKISAKGLDFNKVPSSKRPPANGDAAVELLRQDDGILVTCAGEGCGCDMLNSPVSDGTAILDLKSRWIPLVAESVEKIAMLSDNGFRFAASWYGDEAKHTEQVTLKHLLSLIQANNLNRYTAYSVSTRKKR